MKKRGSICLALLLSICMLGAGCSLDAGQETDGAGAQTDAQMESEALGASGDGTHALDEVPQYSGEPYAIIDDNAPGFEEQDLTTKSFESYSDLDSLGRCGTAYANIGLDLMPTDQRGSINQVKPSGWHSVQYDIVEGDSLYNRCHLIGYQLTGENANEENLITGTRAMNVDGMLPFEDMVADYIKETENHVLYRVTPVFHGDDLLASGVQMEAQSVEDQGEGISFNVYVYNNQPGVSIDYATGDSRLSGAGTEGADGDGENAAASDQRTGKGKEAKAKSEAQSYVLNTNTKKFHQPDCPSVKDMKASNKKKVTGTQSQLEQQGYEPCGNCMQ